MLNRPPIPSTSRIDWIMHEFPKNALVFGTQRKINDQSHPFALLQWSTDTRVNRDFEKLHISRVCLGVINNIGTSHLSLEPSERLATVSFTQQTITPIVLNWSFPLQFSPSIHPDEMKSKWCFQNDVQSQNAFVGLRN